MLKLIIYFGSGMLFDILSTMLYIAIEKRQQHVAGIISAVLTYLSCMVFVNLTLSPDVFDTVTAYALGCGLGTYLTVAVKGRMECKGVK
jgi:multidrug transporter EmrE-like cation transporter